MSTNQSLIPTSPKRKLSDYGLSSTSEALLSGQSQMNFTPAPLDMTMPVSEMSSNPAPVPTLVPEPTESSMASQLSSIKQGALEAQSMLDAIKEKEAGTTEGTSTTDGTTDGTTEGDPVPIGDYVPEVSPEDATAEQAKAGYFDTMNTDTAGEKEKIRQDAQLSQKRQFANSLYNEILSEEKAHRDEVRRLRTNPEGKSMGALNAQIQRLEMDYSSTRADDMLAYNVALGDFQEAEKTVNARIADLDADLDRKAQMWAMAFQFAQDDMTESEKLTAQQNFDKYMAKTAHEYDIQAMELNDKLTRGRMAYEASLKGAEEQADPTSALSTIAYVRESIERIKGRDASEGKEAYDALYENAGANPVAEWFRTKVGSRSTGFTQLKTYADSLRANMLMLGSDPAIRDFFGPQMSERDVDMMMSSATNLQTDNLTPSQVLDEVNRIENFIGKYESAVRAKQAGYEANPNLITAPDGVEYVIVD